MPEKETSGTVSHGTASRKAEHLRINLEEDVSAKGVTSGLERFRFVPRTLPEIDLADVSTVVDLFGYRLGAPVFVSCMTGGVPEAGVINRALARVAQRHRLALGLGSGRVLLEHPEALPSFDVRSLAPDVPIFANIGAVQLKRGVGVDECRRLVDLLRADALVLHLNALQEALQPEGDTVFGGVLERIAQLCRRLEVPVIAKEVGWGIAPDVALRLLEAGVSAVDVAGTGGTSWSEVERHRMTDPVRRRVAAAFADWGLPTADAVRLARRAAPDALIFASGGIRNGMDAAKAVALGADLVGVAGTFLRAASQGEEAASELASEFIETLRIVMFCLGESSVASLRGTPRLISDDGRDRTALTVELALGSNGIGSSHDITDQVMAAVAGSAILTGVVHCFLQDAGATIQIGTPPARTTSLISTGGQALDRLVPPDLHRSRDGHGPAHAVGAVESGSDRVPLVSAAAPVVGGRLWLGADQRITVVELGAPRERRVTLQVLGQ